LKNLYIESWGLYKSHTESFYLDLDYYLNFCKNKKTLDLFAGYGRISNYLSLNNINVEAVELDPNFAKFIRLKNEKVHVCNVLNFNPSYQFERIIAGFNSFCLLINEDDIQLFFKKIDSWLTDGGQASLSYYHPNYWHIDANQVTSLVHNNKTFEWRSKQDLSKRNKKQATWIDIYKHNDIEYKYEYPIRLYESEKSLVPFLSETRLKLINTIKYYQQHEKNGWIEFILQKE
jgi:hypothetical protein